jgi:hypothetical protein
MLVRSNWARFRLIRLESRGSDCTMEAGFRENSVYSYTQLSMPGDPEPGFVPYIRTEKVNFSDGSHPVGSDPWPLDADGTVGYSLHRNSAASYGNDVANWLAAGPMPVTPDVFWIELQQMGSGMSLVWTMDGVLLQSTSEISGPWTNVTGATSPFEIVPDLPVQFFRLYTSP